MRSPSASSLNTWQHRKLPRRDVTSACRDRFTLKSKVDGKRLFEKTFAFAEELRTNGEYDATQGRAFIGETLANDLD